ncbi:MAG: hypothetical protein HND39_14490 [Ignavibacteriota bacterium]|jgi:hypothetical protein|nr:MAG: hypothetical protein EDM72_13120 [Chlorobiota bacterium]MBE7478050.1 hypothetical protein [Ignavibacteriales bacterium]MBL1123389.1 hypothetical protein [Ignavibacteriota bacterium]MBV6421222.1 hypothetical protein [Ignavibacteriaceae bacterium]MCE7856638.1 hypothetical protein [Ignavibacteria bacterium CHB3]MEB2296517.1 hypothetical protein [Ignavibacteria bacterium]
MRNFEVTLTFKPLVVNKVVSSSVLINKQRVVEISLDDQVCISPEEFCEAVINIKERPDVVRLNIVERFTSTEKPLYWIKENYGRIYFHNGVPIVLNKN